MWDLIKNDPILKTISIFIVGIFSFAFAFSIMFGSSQGQSGSGGEHDHASTSTGYSAATGLGEIIILLSKFLIIILLIAIIITAVKFIQKHVIGNEPIRGMEQLKNKPFMTILVGIGGILLLLVAINLLPSSNGNEMVQSTASVHTNTAVFGLTAILSQLVKLIAVVSFIGLVVSLGMYFKDRYFNNIKAITLENKELCNNCGFELKANWKCCPSCGFEKNKNEAAEIINEDNGIN